MRTDHCGNVASTLQAACRLIPPVAVTALPLLLSDLCVWNCRFQLEQLGHSHVDPNSQTGAVVLNRIHTSSAPASSPCIIFFVVTFLRSQLARPGYSHVDPDSKPGLVPNCVCASF